MIKRVQEETRRDSLVRAALMSWDALNEVVSEMDEEDVMRAMREESAGARRKTFLKRLTQRLNGIRIEQVKDEVAKTSEEVLDDGSARRNRRRN